MFNKLKKNKLSFYDTIPNKYKIIFQKVQIPFTVYNVIFKNSEKPADFILLFVNKDTEPVTGLQSSNVIGKTVLQLSSVEDNFWFEKYMEVYESGKPVFFDYNNSKTGKSYLIGVFMPCDTKIVTLFAEIETQLAPGTSTVTSDLKFKSVFDAISEPVIIHDIDTLEIVDVNKAFLEIYHFNSENEVKAINIETISSAEDGFTQLRANELMMKAKNGEKQQIEWLAKTKNNQRIWLELVVEKVLIGGNERILVFGRNIQSRKTAEQKLIESEGRYISFFLKHKLPILIIDPVTAGFIEVNPAACRFYGYKAEEFITKKISDINPAPYRIIRQKLDDAIIEKNNTFEMQHLTATGEIKDVLVYSCPIVFNHTTYLYSLIQDISEKKLAEKKLAESERRFREMLSNLSLLSLILDLDGIIRYANNYLLEMTGWKQDEILEKNWFDLFLTPEDGKFIRSKFSNAIETHKIDISIENRILTRDGESRLISWNNTLLFDNDGNINGVASIGIDITEQRLTEQTIRESKDRLNRAEFASKSGNWELYLEKGIMKYSEGAAKVYGLKEAEFNYENIKKIPLPEYRLILDEALDALIKHKKPYDLEFKIQSADTEEIKDIHSTAIYDAERKVLFGVIQDITEKKKVQSAFDRANRHFQAIIEKASDGVALVGVDGKFKYISPTALKMFGYDAGLISDYSPNDLTHPDDLPDVLFHLGTLLNDKSHQPTLKYRFKHQNGRWLWIESTFTNMIDEPFVESIVINFKDIDERVEAENKLKNSKIVLNQLLSETNQLINSDSYSIDYKRFTDVFAEISGAWMTIFNEFEINGLDFTTKAFSGIVDAREIVRNYFGFNALEFKWKHDQGRDDLIKNRIFTRFEKLSDLTRDIVPSVVVKTIEKAYKLGPTYIVSITKDKKRLGDFTLVFKKGKDIENNEAIEIFANQIAEYLIRKRAEEALHSSEEKYRLMFENNPQPMWIIDANSYAFIEVNRAAVEHYGYTKEEFLKMTVKDVRVKEDIEALNDLTKQDYTTYKSAKPVGNIKKNGEIIYVELVSFKFIYKGKDARHVMINDITERKKTEESILRKMDELLRFHNLTVDRELAMVQLKKEVNDLLRETGKPEKYKIISR